MNHRAWALGTLCLLLAAAAGQAADTLEPVQLKGLGVAGHLSARDNGWKIETLLPLMRQMGVTVIRQEILWDGVENPKGVYTVPAVHQDWFDQATGAGLKVILLLCYGNAHYENPLDPDAFANYAAFLAGHFKGRVAAYEIWNEPVYFQFPDRYGGDWNGRHYDAWLKRYAELVGKTAAALKKVDPVTPVIAGTGMEAATHYLLLRYADRLRQVDGLAIHPYTYRLPPESVSFGGPAVMIRDGVAVADDDHSMTSEFRRLREATRHQLGRELPLWATEFGYSTFNHHPADSIRDNYAGFSESTQAMYLLRALIQGFAAGVTPWCIYDFTDDGTDRKSAEANFGLVKNFRLGYQPKPAFYAIRNLAKLLGPDWELLAKAPATVTDTSKELHYVQEWQVPTSDGFVTLTGMQVYWFKRGADYITFIWKAGPRKDEYNDPLAVLAWDKMPAMANIDGIDLMTGQAVPLDIRHQDGRCEIVDIPIRPAPLAIRWRPAPAAP